jgi:hypothetical protein
MSSSRDKMFSHLALVATGISQIKEDVSKELEIDPSIVNKVVDFYQYYKFTILKDCNYSQVYDYQLGEYRMSIPKIESYLNGQLNRKLSFDYERAKDENRIKELTDLSNKLIAHRSGLQKRVEDMYLKKKIKHESIEANLDEPNEDLRRDIKQSIHKRASPRSKRRTINDL